MPLAGVAQYPPAPPINGLYGYKFPEHDDDLIVITFDPKLVFEQVQILMSPFEFRFVRL